MNEEELLQCIKNIVRAELSAYADDAPTTDETIAVDIDCGCVIEIHARVNPTGWVNLGAGDALTVTVKRCGKHTG